ncbi:uncharacterized protein LOC143557812 [Bidens hawaiensis]|uniref:uncharacterized protein LOC143557812 n=1 Tax=Bidens hawaiensis TaxID=980011 RepID=UPI00404979B2
MHWQWRSNPTTAAEVAELFNLMEAIYEFEWKGGIDKWKWKACSTGEFSVSSVKKLLAAAPSPISQVKMHWKVWTPMKCKLLVWRSIINRLPTKDELSKRGVILQNHLCELCDMDVETNTHLFTGCFFTAEVWNGVEAWCRLQPMVIFDVTDLLQITSSQPFSKTAKYILRDIIYVVMWAIWIERNDRIFKGKRRRAIEVVESIKMSSYF